MKPSLYSNPGIEVRRSKLHGWGVFAKEAIKKGEILEEVPFLVLPVTKGRKSSILLNYRYNYPHENWQYQVLPLGFAALYNHSEKPNAEWITDEENEIFIFSATRNIRKDAEICIYYGDEEYWNDGRNDIILK